MHKFLPYILLSVLFPVKFYTSAQTTTDLASKNEKLDNFKFLKTDYIFGSRVFIKNNGQFDKNIPNSSKVLYGYESGVDQIYFTATGLTYVLETVKPIDSKVATKSASKSLEENQKVDLEKKYVSVSWENANANIQVVESEKQSHFFSYGDKAMQSNCYKKITYKNVYNHIDIEYLFPNDKKTGVKYNVIVYPGGNSNDIKIKYDGDIEKMNFENGNITIQTSNGKITETAPLSFQKGQNVASAFSLKEKTISFDFLSGYNKNDTLVIDPWVWLEVNDVFGFIHDNIPVGFNQDYYEGIFDVDYDNAGDLYFYGQFGRSAWFPYYVVKYDHSGVHQWTFTGTIPSATLGEADDWLSQGPFTGSIGQGQPGCFAVDKVTGNIYVGQNKNFGGNAPNNGPRIVRIKTEDASYDNFISTANPDFRMLTNIIVDCKTPNIYVFGQPSGDNQINNSGILDTTSRLINPVNLSDFGLPSPSPLGYYAFSVICPTMDLNGSMYFIAAGNDPQHTNMISKINSTFTAKEWQNSTTFNVFTDGQNAYMGSSYKVPNAFNAITSNSHYLFYYDGGTLVVFSKTDGSKIASAVVPNLAATGSFYGNPPAGRAGSGIAVDDCNNIYVATAQQDENIIGSDLPGHIIGYNFDGTNLIQNGDFVYSLNFSGDRTTYHNDISDIKYKADTKELFVSGSGFVGICPAFNSLNCDGPDPVSILPVADLKICKGDSLQLKAADGFYNYHWSPNGETTQTIEAKTAGTYTVSATLGCSPSYNSTSQTMTVLADTADVNVSASLKDICVGNATTLTATEGLLSYTWSPATGLSTTSGSVVTAHPTVPTTYVVTGISDKFCITVDSISIGILPKADTVTSTLTLSLGETTTLTASTVGSYVWSPSSGLSCATCQTTTVLPLNSLNYCVEITDENKCSSTECFDIKLNTSCGELFVPNAFSPNNDGKNDLLKVEINPYCVLEYSIQIFDRWGELVFESTKISDSWDGKVNGKELDNAVFVYQAKVKLINPEASGANEIEKKGNVSIIK